MQERAPQPQDSAAFKEKLVAHVEHGNKTKVGVLLQPESRSDVVVRSLNWEEALANSKFNPIVPGGNLSAEEYARITKQHFDELGSYGIQSPVQFMVAERDRKVAGNSTKEEVYAMVHNITAAKNPEQA